MTNLSGGPEAGLKRAYHAPVVLEFGSVSETTATFGEGENFVPAWLDDPQNTPGGGGGGGLS